MLENCQKGIADLMGEPYMGVISENSSIFILPTLLSPILMSINTIGRVVDVVGAAILLGVVVLDSLQFFC